MHIFQCTYIHISQHKPLQMPNLSGTPTTPFNVPTCTKHLTYVLVGERFRSGGQSKKHLTIAL